MMPGYSGQLYKTRKNFKITDASIEQRLAFSQKLKSDLNQIHLESNIVKIYTETKHSKETIKTIENLKKSFDDGVKNGVQGYNTDFFANFLKLKNSPNIFDQEFAKFLDSVVNDTSKTPEKRQFLIKAILNKVQIDDKKTQITNLSRASNSHTNSLEHSSERNTPQNVTSSEKLNIKNFDIDPEDAFWKDAFL